MRVALISDIHSNLPGLEAALSAVKRHHPERIISLGDQVNNVPRASPARRFPRRRAREVGAVFRSSGACASLLSMFHVKQYAPRGPECFT